MFCDVCDSKGLYHKKTCPKRILRTGTAQIKTEAEIDRVEELAKKIDQLAEIVVPLAEKVMKQEQENPQEVVKEAVKEKEVVKEAVKSAVEQSLDAVKEMEDYTSTMIPAKWANILREVLGNDFDMTIGDAGHGNFSISIFLPKGLDRRSPKDAKTRDFSTGLVRRATAENDVRDWCQRIRKNIESTTTYKFSV